MCSEQLLVQLFQDFFFFPHGNVCRAAVESLMTSSCNVAFSGMSGGRNCSRAHVWRSVLDEWTQGIRSFPPFKLAPPRASLPTHMQPLPPFTVLNPHLGQHEMQKEGGSQSKQCRLAGCLKRGQNNTTSYVTLEALQLPHNNNKKFKHLANVGSANLFIFMLRAHARQAWIDCNALPSASISTKQNRTQAPGRLPNKQSDRSCRRNTRAF